MEELKKLLQIINNLSDGMDTIVEAGEASELRLHALLVCMAGVLRVMAREPEMAAKVAAEISASAESMHAVAMGYPLTDEFLARRTKTLHSLLPPGLQDLVKLPT